MICYGHWLYLPSNLHTDHLVQHKFWHLELLDWTFVSISYALEFLCFWNFVSCIDSTFHFLAERWKDHLPSDYLVKEASVDQPSEEDVCRCHFVFVQESISSVDSQLVLTYQWFVGDRTLSNFTVIPDATGEVISSCGIGNVFELFYIN